MSFDVKLNMLHQDIDLGSFDARGTVEQFSNGSGIVTDILIY